MRRQTPELTDEDLERLARLGGGEEQIAEAAGIDTAQVRRRLAEAPRPISGRRSLELTTPVTC